MAKIASATPNGMWNAFHKFSVTLDNGVSGIVYSKTPQLRFNVGDEVSHEVNDKGSMKLDKPQYGGSSQSYVAPAQGASRDELIVRQVALKAAVEYGSSNGADVNTVLSYAESFNDWVMQKPQAVSYDKHFEQDPF